MSYVSHDNMSSEYLALLSRCTAAAPSLKSISGVATSGTLTVLHCSVGQRLVRFINIGNPTIVVGVPEGHLRMDAVWVGKEDNNEKKIL